MGLLGVEQDRKDPIGHHPLNQKLRGETLIHENPVVLDDLVQIFDALDPSFHEAGLEAH